jgi:TorA maturation chaperone TorD
MSKEEIDKLYSEYCKDNIERLKKYKIKHPNRRIKWSKLSREQFVENLSQTITSNGRIYNKEALKEEYDKLFVAYLKEEYDKLVVAYKDRTDLDIEHPGPLPKLKWWQKLFNIKPKQR